MDWHPWPVVLHLLQIWLAKDFTAGLASSPIVYAGDYGNALCLLPGEGGAWTTGTDFTGKIVVCDRGENDRVNKAIAVENLSATGFVLANNAISADALVGDAYVIPGVHITYADGVLLKAWLGTGTGHMATILVQPGIRMPAMRISWLTSVLADRMERLIS